MVTPVPKTRIQIAKEYDIMPKTLVQKLRRLGIELPPGDIMPADQERIYQALGAIPAPPAPPPISPPPPKQIQKPS